MEVLGYIFDFMGAALNGAMQVFADFINLIIDNVPNPDPFPGIIEQMPTEVLLDRGMWLYWIDQLIGVEVANGILTGFLAAWIVSLVFALIFKLIDFIKP